MSEGLIERLGDRAKAWLARMKGKDLEVRQGVTEKVCGLANEGFSTDGVWWDGPGGSTHLRLWSEVDRDLQEPGS